MSSSISVYWHDKELQIRVSGHLDETTKWPDLTDAKPSRVQIDLKGVTSMNSFGCKGWQNWVYTVKPGQGISLHNCTSAFVRQLNLLVGLLPPHTTVQSFYVPYSCELCNHEQEVLLQRPRAGEDFVLPLERDQMLCPSCQGWMSLDADTARYFKFLRVKSA